MAREGGTGWRLAAPALAWLAGVGLHLRLHELPPRAWCAGLTAAGALALLAASLPAILRPPRRADLRSPRDIRSPGIAGLARPGRNAALALAVTGALALGFGASAWRACELLAEALPDALEGRDVVVEGTVASLPQRSSTGLRFRFEVDESSREPAGASGARLPGTLALGWYSGYHEDAALTQPQTELRAGQRWRFALRLRQPHGNLNPDGFDLELMLFEQGVRATGYVRDAPAPLLLQRAAGYPVQRLRQRVRDAIDAAVPDRRAAGMLAALSIGDQGAIERDDWDLYRTTGIAHLVSISGLHVTMFAWLAGAGIAALWRRSPRASLALPAPLAARWGGVAAAAAYAVFSGWGVPSQRTVWMLAAVALLQSLGVRWPWPLVLLAAAVAVTAVDPWALLQAGFWLSFMAVALLMASSPAAPSRAAHAPAGPPLRALLRRAAAALRDGVRTQAITTVGLAPLSIVFFQQLSLVGFAANLVAIPLVTLAITPLALLGAALPPLWLPATRLVELLNAMLGWLASWPLAAWSAPVAPPWAQAAALAGAALLMLPLPRRARLLGVPMLLGLLAPPLPRPAPGAFELLAADIGQGTAVLVRTRDHLLLFDAGPQYSRDSDAGQRVLLPLLRARGHARIDRLVLSHRDMDHVGGARALLGALPVDAASTSLEAGHPLLALMGEGRHTRCQAGQSWTWDGVRFDMLRPLPDDYARAGVRSNAMSCVLRVAGGGRSALLTGDIERAQEAQLVAAMPETLRSDVLIAPHHGSRTSSSAVFLDAVQPRLAVFQAGYRNRFGHPAPDVLARYRERGVAIVASPACGAWLWSSGPPQEGVCWRDAARRYWHHAPARE